VAELAPPLRGRLLREEPLAAHTTLRIGGPAALYGVPADEADVATVAAWAAAAGLSWHVIGLGSNLLCPDEGFAGLVPDLERACAGAPGTGSGCGPAPVSTSRRYCRRPPGGASPGWRASPASRAPSAAPWP